MMRPRVGVLLAQQQAEERRLPRARRADEEDELALADVERDVAQRDDVALVDLGDVLESNHRRPSSEADRERLSKVPRVFRRRLAAPSAPQGPGTRDRSYREACSSDRDGAPPSRCRRHWRYASMNASRSPSSTAWTLPVSWRGALVLHQLVRRQRVACGSGCRTRRPASRPTARRARPLARALPLGEAGGEDLHRLAPCSGSATARSGTTRRCRSAGA